MVLRAVSPIGGGLRFGSFGLSATQTTGIANNNPVLFDTVLAGNLALANATVTLPTPGTYRIMAGVSAGFSTPSRAIFSLQNVTAGTLIGRSALAVAPNFNVSDTSQPIANAIITITAVTDIRLLMTDQISMNVIYSAHTFLEIVQLG